MRVVQVVLPGNAVVAQQELAQLMPATRSAFLAASRARSRSRIASDCSSGIETATSSPLRWFCASLIASRRSVLIRSPLFLGTNEGAITSQAQPAA